MLTIETTKHSTQAELCFRRLGFDPCTFKICLRDLELLTYFNHLNSEKLTEKRGFTFCWHACNKLANLSLHRFTVRLKKKIVYICHNVTLFPHIRIRQQAFLWHWIQRKGSADLSLRKGLMALVITLDSLCICAHHGWTDDAWWHQNIKLCSFALTFTIILIEALLY